MRGIFRKSLSVLLAVLMVMSVVPASVLTSASASAASLGYVVGDVIEFGYYPQSEVTDSAIISELESLTLDWVSYGFMSGDGEFGSMTESDYMKYADVELGGEKYRAVTFNQYRPNLTYHASTQKNSNQDDNGYFADTVYWFKFEPLKWQIIDAENGIIMSESLIDAQAYAETVYNYENGGSTEDDYYLDSAHKNYANDYAESSLREWLNDEFYSTAFSSDEKSKIMTYKADNSASVSKYDSSSTRDYVFIPSSADVNNADMGFATDADRTAKGTDYAKALGLYVPESGENSFWWLRTPGTYSYYACRVDNSGKTDEYGNSIDFTNYGVRPAIRYDFDGTGERYTATFMVDGEIYAQNSYAVGDEIVVPEDPEKENYNFSGWDLEVPATMGYEDMTFNAVFQVKSYLAGGECGDGIKWYLYGSGKLIISGSGEMYDFEAEASPWYKYRSFVKIVELPSGVTKIGDYAFEGCENLTEFYFSRNIASIGSHAFEGTGLTSVNLPYSITSVNDASFSGCTKLENVVVSATVEMIGSSAFEGCTSLGSVSIANSVTEIADSAFGDCPSLTDVYYSGSSAEWNAVQIGEQNDDLLNATKHFASAAVTFMSEDAVFESVTCSVGSTVDAPSENPSKYGYEFLGWYDENGNPATFPVTVAADMTFTAHFAANTYTVTYYTDDTVYTVQNYAYGDAITAPEAPSKTGYTFKGWSRLSGGAVSDDLGTVTGNISLYAVWESGEISYKINIYQMNTLGMYSTKASESVTLSGLAGETVTYTPEERAGFTVDSRSTLSATVAGDGTTVLKVYYARNQYTLTIDGTEYVLYYGATVPEEVKSVEEREGLEFVGFVNENGESVEIPAKMPAENLNLTSVWASAYYTLTFIVDGLYTNYNYAYGDYIEAVETPTKEGYTFVGWSETEGGEVATLPDTMPAKDLTYYAVWERMAVSLVTAEGWEFVVDNDNMAITGVLLGTTEDQLRGGLEVSGDGYFEIILTEKGKVGTGTVVSLYDNVTGDKVGDYTVVIMGDLDGDGLSTGEDGRILEDEILGVTCWSRSVTEEYNLYLVMASDANEDGRIAVTDFYYLEFGTYNINLYTMGTDGSYELTEEKTGYYGVCDETVSYSPDPAEEGFYIDTEKSVLEGENPAGNSFELSVYYAREQYSITYIVDGVIAAQYTYLYGATIVVPEDPVKEGYTFSGWSMEIPETMPAEDITVYATFGVNRYDVIYMDGNENFRRDSHEYGSLVTVTESFPAKEGYTFGGWVTADGDPVYDFIMPAQTLRFYASWIANTDISYTLEGYIMETTGEYVLAYSTVKAGTTGEEISITPEELEGFTFDAEKSVISGTVAPDGSTVLKIYYARNTYTVTFTVDGEVYDESVYYYGSTLVEPVNPSKENYVFAGWYNVNGNFAAFPITVESDLTFEATWEVAEVKLIPAEDSLTVIDRTGDVWFVYGYDEWGVYDEQGMMIDVQGDGYYEVIPYDGYDYGTGATINVYDNSTGELVETFYSIFFGELNHDMSNDLYDYAIVMDEINGVTSWSDKSSDEYVPYMLKAADLSGNGKVDHIDAAIIYGKTEYIWEINQKTGTLDDYDDEHFTVSYYLEETLYDRYYGSGFAYGETIILPEEPTKEGYTFAGWYDYETGEPISVTMPEKNVFAYAKWEAETAGEYTITLDANGGKFSIGLEVYTITAEYCEVIDFYENPTREGYEFYGWVNEDGEEMCIPATMPDINETWYAVWKAISYDAVFDANGGTWEDGETTKTVTAEYDTEITAPEPPIRDGYVFVGWSPDVSLMEVGGNTYVATWEEAEYTATYYVDGEVYEAYSIFYGEEVDMPADPYKEGYTFMGWSPDVPAIMPAMDLEFHAVWEIEAVAEPWCEYTFNEVTGELVISGEGDMPDFIDGDEPYWVEHQADIKTVIIEEGITSIGAGAFLYYSSLTSVTIPDSVTSIGEEAFGDCSSLTSVTIPDSVISIGEAAFLFCSSLTSITIGDSVTSIGDYAFEWCESLTSITIPDSVISVGYCAFLECSSLTSITIGNSVTSIDNYAFAYCNSIAYVYYTGTEEDWNAITIESGNDPLTNATIHFESSGFATPTDALNITTPENALASTSNVNAVTGSGIINLSDADASLEFTEAYYLGEAVKPVVYLQYGDELFDAKKELEFIWLNNDKVGTAEVALSGLNRFSGGVSFEFTISYEEIPEQIVNVTAVGDIGKILLSWGISSEVNTKSYNIYRREEGSDEYLLIKTVNGRETLSYTDSAVEEGKTYIYYVTGVGLYGAESVPSAEVYATVQYDEEGPTVFKLKPASNTTLYATQTLSITAEDNVGIAKAVYSYSEDDGATWNAVGEATGSGFACNFDTTVLSGTAVSVKVVAYDKAGNASEEIINTYKVDNIGPEKVTGLSASVQSSIITLSWNDVADADASYFILQQKINGTWTTVQSSLKTKGANVEDLQAETEYTFRVACVDIRGNVGEFSDEFTVSTAEDTTIPAITGQTPSPARFRSAFTYTATAQDECGVASIRVQVSYDEENWTDIGSKTFTDVAKIQKYSCTVNTDEFNEGYLYVRAIATDISGNESISDKTAPCRGYYIDRTAPDAPTGLKASGQDGYINLEWTVGTENDLGGYYVYRSTEENGEYTAIASNRAVYNYPDQSVERGKVYYYKIRVSDTCGNMSDYSEIVSAKMLDDTIKPVVRGIGETYNNSLSKSYNSFNVVASDNNMLSYMVVEYCTTKNMTYAEAARAESIADSYRNISVKIPMDGLESGDKVYVRAYAVDIMGLKSDYVNAQYTVDLTAPSASDFKATIVNNKVTLTWNDCAESDLAGFKVYHSANGTDYTLAGSRGIKSSGTYSFIHYINTQQSGTYFYKIVPMDKLQNSSEFITSVEYTYIAPEIPDDPETEVPPVIIVNEAPVASFTCKSFMILDVEDEFDASASTDDSEITEYIWDFGDGTTSTEIKPVKKYSAVGTYTVTLTVKDAEGLQHSVTQNVEVKEREKLGTLKVKVVDENGSAVAYSSVYFDLGTEAMQKVKTDSSGIITMLLSDGTHRVGAYKDHYLPAEKEIVVLPNATRTITLTIVKGDIITGEFEITRMTFDEIIAAGIDPYDPDNRQVYSATVRFTYGTTPININYYRNDNSVLSYTVSDTDNTSRPSGSGSYTPSRTFKAPDGEERKIVNVTYIGGDNNNDDVVAILDVPAQASYLKEIFDVKLHIVNNAAENFVMKNNEIKLNVPDGMTLMTGLNGGYQNSDTVYINAIKGQNTVTISWCLRGDVAGEYDLTADYTGILADFEELVTTTFKTEEPIKVYGLEGVKFRILGADEIHNDTFYFNVELENQRDVDLLLPDIGVIDNKVYNITDRVLLSESEGGGGFDSSSFDSTVYLLNIYVQLGNGEKQYLPISYSRTGNLSANLELLSPGQKLVHEYVAYNAINYDGIAHFEDAAIVEFEGLLENIEVGSFTKERYSYTDFSEKFNNIYSGSSQEITDAYMYVNDNSNYYYYCDAELATDGDMIITEVKEVAINTLLSSLYYSAPVYAATQPMNPLTFKLLFDWYNGEGPTQVDINTVELKGLSSEDERKLIKNELLKILTSENITQKVLELEMVYNYNTVKKFIGEVESGIKQFGNADDVAALSLYWASNTVEYASLLKQSGGKALYNQLKADIASYCGDLKEMCQETSDEKFFKEILGLDVNEMLSKVTDLGVTAVESVFDAYAKTQEDAYYQAMVHYHCNNEVAKAILNALVNVTQNTGIATNVIIADVASEFLDNIEMSEEELKDLTDEFLANYAKDLASEIFSDASKAMLNNIIKFAFGATVAGVVSLGVYVVKYVLNEVINIDNHKAQENALITYARLSDAFSKMFRIRTPGTEFDDFISMVMLMGLCELRLAGEAQYKRFMQEYIDGVYPWAETTEEEVMEKLNAIKNTDYETLAEWYDVVQYNLVSSRDILFNIELTETNIPSAPSVTLDYENCQTVQSFGDEYEYCFGDGVWKSCNGKPVEFELDTVPQTLRVRVAASDTNLAGEITTVRIYAQKELSKLITVKFDSGKYIFSNLTSQRSYEAVLLNTSISTPDWSEAMYVSGGEISCDTESDYIALRSRPSDSLLETYSVPLVLKVQKKQLLDLTIKGDGTVEQSNASGEYFVGDTVDLIATPHTGCEFLGWYIDGELVSEDVHYILEYAEDVKVKAEFTGVTVKSIEIESMPSKTVYTVGENLSTDGMTLKVRYSDLSTKVIESGFVCSESVLAKDGETTVTVTYGGATAEFTVNVYKEYYILTWVVEGESVEFEMKYGEVLDFEITMDRPGYIFTGWTPEVPLTMPAHDVTLTATFEPETYDAIFDANGGAFADGSTDITVPVDYDALIVAPTAPEKEGYLFAGWSYNGVNLGENLGTMNRVGGMIFKAEWIAATDTVYTVETYTMDTAGEYVLSTQLMTGVTDETVTVEPTLGEGFKINTEKSVLSGAVAGDNSLVLKVYIDRLAYTLTVDNGIEPVSDVYYYGAIIAPVETPEKTGYTFNGWDNEFPATMPAKDMTITAVFEANTYDAVFMNGSETFATVSVKFDEKITAPDGTPEKEDFNFIGWSLDGTIILSDIGTMDETGKTFYAVWQAYSPDHEHIPHTVTIDATCTVDGMEYAICLECGETIGEAVVLPALNHSETQTVTVESTCTVPGMQYEICAFCGETIGEAVVIPASGHKAGEWETTKNATCTENGEQIKKCTVCGETLETGVIEAVGHKAGEWETTKNATCTENGEQIKKCTVCGETLETGVIEAVGHKAGEWETTKNATCTENGEQIKKCTVCGETLETKSVKAKGHTPAAEWTVVLEPTAKTEGKKIKKCTVCGKTAQEAVISKLEVAHHEDTDVAIEYQPDDYKGEVSINVEETFDGGAFNVVNTQTGSAKTQIFDITMTVDGVETQPQGKVTVRIPLPEGYNPKRSFVYHIDTKTGKAVKMNSRYENGYLVFETDHFSYYAVVDESQAGTAVNASLSIKQPSITTVKYGDTLILHAEIKGEIPDGARIEWSIEGEGVTIKPSADGTTCAVTSTANGEVTVTAKLVDKNGNALNTSDGGEISAQQKLVSKAGFFQKLISFFKNLFRMNRIIEQDFKSIF